MITSSNSEWPNPLRLVPKQSEGYCCCCDYHTLISITKCDRYPVPNINSFTMKLANKQPFSKIPPNQNAPDDIPKTVIISPMGFFHCEFMPFRLKYSAATFQRYMDKIFRDIDCIYIYIYI